MTERVREILSWYGADNPGTLTNLARLLNPRGMYASPPVPRSAKRTTSAPSL